MVQGRTSRSELNAGFQWVREGEWAIPPSPLSPEPLSRLSRTVSGPAACKAGLQVNSMFDDVSDFDRALEQIGGAIDQVRGRLGDRSLRIELAEHLAPKSTPFRVPSGLGEAIDRRIAPAGMDALNLFRALRDVNKDVPDQPGKVEAMVAAIVKLKQSMIPLSAEVALQIGFR